MKYAPLKTDFVLALTNDETIKSELSVDMSEAANEQDIVADVDYAEAEKQDIESEFFNN